VQDDKAGVLGEQITEKPNTYLTPGESSTKSGKSYFIEPKLSKEGDSLRHSDVTNHFQCPKPFIPGACAEFGAALGLYLLTLFCVRNCA
jgi:hypothetical protein